MCRIVHSSLFEIDMASLGYPARTTTQAAGEYFVEQRTLAVRRLRSQRATGRYDGMYLIGNSPVALCEVKRYDALDSAAEWDRAKGQLIRYALSEDFGPPPPFLVLYCGKPSRNRFFRLKTLGDASLLDELSYEELDEIWSWERIKEFHLRGEFAQEVVDAERLREILQYHLDRIEDTLRSQVTQAIQVVKAGAHPLVGDFGRWLLDRPIALERMRHLYERKVAEIGNDREKQVAGEIVTQAALNYLNKVFFLSLVEDRHLPGFYRIMREFLPRSRADTTSSSVAVFLALLRRRIKDTTATWDPEDESVYRSLRQELAPAIQTSVIEQNSWRELIQVAFDLAAERFPLVYREDVYDYYRPSKEALAELVYDLSTKSFAGLTNRHVGDIYQSLLSARRRQQARLGAFYTPHGDVTYMVSRLNLQAESRVLDPCMGSGHFLEAIVETLAARYAEREVAREDAYRQIVAEQLFGADIDSFALSLAAIRLFLLSEDTTDVRPHLYVHDMLLHSPERQTLFTDAERVVGVDSAIDEPSELDSRKFDAVVGNPPYGARKPKYKERVYSRLYGFSLRDQKAGSIATGDRDTYAIFLANGIERLREGGRLCLITNDSYRTLTTYGRLRKRILDTCKIVELLLTDTKHFEGVSFQFAGMAIITLERCGDASARLENVMRLVDYVRDPNDFASPPADKVHALRQAEYDALPETPFFVGVPRDVVDAAKSSLTVRDVARGRQGLATADDARFLAHVTDPRVAAAGLATPLSAQEQAHGIPALRSPWVPFAKGEGFGEYWRDVQMVIDWSADAVAELERRARLPTGTSKRPRLQNRDFYFRPGLTYSVVSGGRVSVRLLPDGWIFSHKGSAIFVEDDSQSELFRLGYLNSALATYFMKKIVNTTATADVGYVEKLPYRKPSPEVEALVVDRVTRIVDTLKKDPAANVAVLRNEIDDAIFELFAIGQSRDEVRHFYTTVGRVQREEVQAASE